MKESYWTTTDAGNTKFLEVPGGRLYRMTGADHMTFVPDPPPRLLTEAACSAIWEEMLMKIGRLQRERDELQAEVSRLRATIRDLDTEPRTPGCECQLEAGDSPCRVHGEDDHPRTTETP